MRIDTKNSLTSVNWKRNHQTNSFSHNDNEFPYCLIFTDKKKSICQIQS